MGLIGFEIGNATWAGVSLLLNLIADTPVYVILRDRHNLFRLAQFSGGIRLLSKTTARRFSLNVVRSFLPLKAPVRWLRKDAKPHKPPKESGAAPPSQKPGGNGNSNRHPWLSGMAVFITFSTGLSIAITYYFSRVAKPTEVSYKVFEELLARGEVRSIKVSQTHNAALVLLHSPQMIEGRGVFVICVPLKSETALDFEKRVREFESKIGIQKTDQIPLTISHEMTSNDMITAAILTSAVLATVAVIWIRKNVPPNSPPIEAISVAIQKLAYKGGKSQFKEPKTASKDQMPRSPLPPKDEPNVGDGLPGMGEPQPITTDVTFNDVAGMHAAKQEVMEFVTYLKNPAKFRELGANLPKGALLLGPPGTGKTLLVKALAHEAEVPFFSAAGSEFIEVIGGLGASRIRKLFTAARQKSPAIIFIDEIDSVGRRRSATGPGGGGGAQEMEQTLNQLLVEMDGMDTTEGTIVFAATNRADLLDKALLRAGRFDRHIFIDLPNKAERKELLDMYLSKYRLSKNIDVPTLRDRLALWTSGMSGADIARLCNEAALITARQENTDDGVQIADFDSALERILAGAAKRSGAPSQPERRVAAVMEAGRALVASLLPSTGLTPFRVSIVPRVSSGDADPSERYLLSSDDIADRLTVLVAGRAAEEFVFKASSDASQRLLKKATELAYKEVREWGMSTVVGNLSFGNPSQNPYSVEPYSKKTAALIDSEVQRLVTEAFQRAVKLIRENEPKLRRIVDTLLEKEVLSADELKGIMGNATPVTNASVSRRTKVRHDYRQRVPSLQRLLAD
nr:paraplegin [Hymenolepis microstoma]